MTLGLVTAADGADVTVSSGDCPGPSRVAKEFPFASDGSVSAMRNVTTLSASAFRKFRTGPDETSNAVIKPL